MNDEKRPYNNQAPRFCENCNGYKLHTRGPKYDTCLTCGKRNHRLTTASTRTVGDSADLQELSTPEGCTTPEGDHIPPASR